MPRRRHKKDYERLASHRNTPHLIENTIVIVLAYLFSGLNLVAAGLRASGSHVDRYLIMVGVAMLLMAPVSILDDRKGMRGMPYTVGCCIIHLAICVMLSFVFSFWWMAVYGCEVLIYFVVIVIITKLSK